MGKSFKDGEGRDWTPRVDGDVIFEYETRTGINIFRAIGENTITGPIPGVKELLILLWLSIAEKAVPLGIDEKSFRKGIRGQSAMDASDALKEALFDFFPKLRALYEAFQSAAKARMQGAMGIVAAGPEKISSS